MKKLLFATMAVAFVVLAIFAGKAEAKVYPKMMILDERGVPQPHYVETDEKGTFVTIELTGKKRIFVREDRAQELKKIFNSKAKKRMRVCPEPKDIKIIQQIPRRSVASKKSAPPKKTGEPTKPLKPAKVKSEASKGGQQYYPPAQPATPIELPKAMGYDEGRRYCPPAQPDDFNRKRVQAKAPDAAPPADNEKPALGEVKVRKPTEKLAVGKIPEDKMPADSDVRRYAYAIKTTDSDGNPIIKKVTITHQSWTNLPDYREVKKGFVWLPGQVLPPNWMQEVGGKMNGIDPETGQIREMEIPAAVAINYNGRGSVISVVGKYSKVPDDRHLLKQIDYEERRS